MFANCDTSTVTNYGTVGGTQLVTQFGETSPTSGGNYPKEPIHYLSSTKDTSILNNCNATRSLLTQLTSTVANLKIDSQLVYPKYTIAIICFISNLEFMNTQELQSLAYLF